MSWLKTTRQFLTLLFGILIILGLFHSCVSYMGYSQSYHRMEEPVFKNFNNYIYLKEMGNTYVFTVDVHGKSVPPEIDSMNYFSLASYNIDAQLKLMVSTKSCIFIDSKFDSLEPDEMDTIVEYLKDKTCVFFHTPILKIKSYFAFKKPRWFYSVTEVDLQKSRFMTSVGLQSVAPLTGDFVVIDTINAPVTNRLLNELQRRDKIIFIK